MRIGAGQFRDQGIGASNTRAAKMVGRNKGHHLAARRSTTAGSYDFVSFGWRAVDESVEPHRRTAFWTQRFGEQLPPTATSGHSSRSGEGA